MPTTGNGKELSNNIDERGRIVDPISLEQINKEPGKSLILDTYAFNIDTMYNLFRGVIDDRINLIKFNISGWDEFFVDVETLNIFNDQGGPLRFINIEADSVLDDLKQLYLSFGGGEVLGDNEYNTRSNDLGVIKPLVWGYAGLKHKGTNKKKNTKKKPKNTKRKPKNTKRKKKSKKKKPKMR